MRTTEQRARARLGSFGVIVAGALIVLPVGVAHAATGGKTRPLTETEQVDRALAQARASGAAQPERSAGEEEPPELETKRVAPTEGVGRSVGDRGNTTGQSGFTPAPMGVDIPPGAGGTRSDQSGQPDFTDNHMGVD